MVRYRWWLGGLAMLLMGMAFAAEERRDALVSGDYVRVRAEPSVTAPQLGFLYNNLRVSVLEKSANTTMIEGKAHYWYRVRQGNLEGWCSGAFLTFDIPATLPDTYAAPADMAWFFARYGGSTNFQDNTFNADAFTVEEYRRMIAATVASGNGTSAPLVLKLSLYRHFQQRPDDPKHQYLKAKLYSPEFVAAMLTAEQYDVLPMLPRDLAVQAVTAWARQPPQGNSYRANQVLSQIPDSAAALRATVAGIILVNSPGNTEVRHDFGFLRQAVSGDGLLLKYAAPAARDDFETVMTAVRNNPSAVQWASDRLKADVRIRDLVGKKAIRQDTPPPGGLLVERPVAAAAPSLPPAPASPPSGVTIQAPAVAENGAVVSVVVTVQPALVEGDTLTLMVNDARACEVRPTGDAVLNGFGAHLRLPGISDIRALVVRKGGARAESVQRIDVAMTGAIPAQGSDSSQFKLKTRENEILVMIQNPMGRSPYVSRVRVSVQGGAAVVDATPWLSADPLLRFLTPNPPANPSVAIEVSGR